MTETIYQVLTPAGHFQVAFGDDETQITEYRGDDLAIQFFKDWLLLNQVSGQDGWRISADSLDPSDLYGFCQPPDSGITVLPPFEDLISYALDDQPDEQEQEDMTNAILDAATGREALQLAKELKQIRAGITELTGRAALTAAKRIRDIRRALGVSMAKSGKREFSEPPINNYVREKEYSNSVKLRPLPGKSFSDSDIYELLEWFKQNGWEAKKSGNFVHGIGPSGSSWLDVPEATRITKADIRGKQKAEAHDAETQRIMDELEALLSKTWLDDNFGDSINYYNKWKLGRYLDDLDKTVSLVANHQWLAPLLEITGLSEDGLKEVLAKKSLADVIKDAYKATIQTNPKTTIADVNAVMPLIKQFIGKSQLSAMGAGVRGEEGQFFKDKFVEVAKVIEGMPKTYDTDGQGDKAIAYLHYFKGAGDWYITEKDSDTDGEGQIQAFGYADLGQGGELGYISIKELIESGVELDLYWSPKSIGAIKGGGDPKPEPAKKGLSDAQKMNDAIISWGGEVVLEMNDSAIAFKLRGAEYNDIEPPYLKFDEGMYRVHYGDGFTDKFGDPWKAIEAYSIAKKQQANTMTTGTDQQNPLKSAFIAELEGLKAETDIDAFNNKLDEIAARIEQAGLMEALDQELNDAADVLTELLMAAENS